MRDGSGRFTAAIHAGTVRRGPARGTRRVRARRLPAETGAVRNDRCAVQTGMREIGPGETGPGSGFLSSPWRTARGPTISPTCTLSTRSAPGRSKICVDKEATSTGGGREPRPHHPGAGRMSPPIPPNHGPVIRSIDPVDVSDRHGHEERNRRFRRRPTSGEHSNHAHGNAPNLPDRARRDHRGDRGDQPRGRSGLARVLRDRPPSRLSRASRPRDSAAWHRVGPPRGNSSGVRAAGGLSHRPAAPGPIGPQTDPANAFTEGMASIADRVRSARVHRGRSVPAARRGDAAAGRHEGDFGSASAVRAC